MKTSLDTSQLVITAFHSFFFKSKGISNKNISNGFVSLNRYFPCGLLFVVLKSLSIILVIKVQKFSAVILAKSSIKSIFDNFIKVIYL